MDKNGLVPLERMYQDYFLDYASYVILGQAVHAIEDGLKPVQRRILHSMRDMDDGRYYKVANIIGQTVQFHPTATPLSATPWSIWGRKTCSSIRRKTGAACSPATARRIPFISRPACPNSPWRAAFNPQTTEWRLSSDGRKREPVGLPMKFPSCWLRERKDCRRAFAIKILPHNFTNSSTPPSPSSRGKARLFTDFLTGGLIDVSD
ncbi:MAG: hypothetical protein IPN74_17920 [Haliscomenobacter sp.]|nr:hypothetical protein [Haliscomenobacter sp.]